MKSIIIIVPLLFLCVFAKAHKKNLVDRVYPLIENVDTINANCRIIKKYKPQKQIAKLLSVVDNTQDTILIIADKSECDIFKIGKTYALSLAEVRQFTYTIIRNGVIMQVFFDRGTKHCTYIPYVNKIKPLLFILLRNNGSDTFRERKVDSNGNCFEDNSVKFVENSYLPMPVTENAGKLQWQNKCYYPSGMLHGPSAIAADVQPLKYGAKELDRQAGADFYDFEARHMDPALGRTTTQDPLAEKYSGLSPYLWCAGNPVRFTDPTGESTQVIPLGNNRFQVQSVYLEDNDKNVYVIEKGKKRIIGVTPSLTTFFASGKDGKKGHVVKSIIDLNDKSGMKFQMEVKSHPNLAKYVSDWGRAKHKWDFKNVGKKA